MVMKKFGDMGKNLTQTWADEADIIEFKNGEVKEIRIVGEGYVPLMRHWVPFKSKKGGIRFFPHDCQRWNVKTGEFDYNLECEACDREINADEVAVMFALDVDKLLEGETEKALGLVVFGGREQQKIQKLTQFNKVDKVAYEVMDSKYGCSIQVLFDKDNRDKSLRWQFTKSQRIPVSIKGDTLKVKIPKNADSDYAGEIFEFELYDIAELIYPVDANKAREKFRIWKVDDALEVVNKERNKEDSGDEEEEEDRKSRKRKRTKDADTGDKKRRSKKERKPVEEEEEDFEEEEDDGTQEDLEDPDDEFEEKEEEQEDEDFEDEPEEKPRKKKLGSKKEKLLAKKKALLQKKKEAGSKKKQPKRPKCFGHMGEEDTEDCAVCDFEDTCIEAATEDDLDD
jgi:hypothetical protein